jgi:hypothetical protein
MFTRAAISTGFVIGSVSLCRSGRIESRGEGLYRKSSTGKFWREGLTPFTGGVNKWEHRGLWRTVLCVLQFLLRDSPEPVAEYLLPMMVSAGCWRLATQLSISLLNQVAMPERKQSIALQAVV